MQISGEEENSKKSKSKCEVPVEKRVLGVFKNKGCSIATAGERCDHN